jgi:DNA-directed RNA polymerase subunit L/DNA-directed RNA polymerase alpha subunit
LKIEAKSPQPINRKKAMSMSTGTSIFQNLKEVDPLTITFTVTPTDVSYVNALRRAILTEVETVGFRSDILEDGSTTHVKVEKNNTPMTNEMLADRVGLLPIFMDPRQNPEYWNPERPRYIFQLDKKSDKETSTDVYASDFEIFETVEGEEKPVKLSSNKEFFHSDPAMLKLYPSLNLTPLIATLKGLQANQVPQEVSIVALATIGKGRDHVRFSPVSQCSYQYTIDDNKDRQKAVFVNWLRTTKKVNLSDVKDEKEQMLLREFNTMEVERCFLKDERDEAYSFDFTVETRGQLDSRTVVTRGIEAMIAKFKTYSTMNVGDLPDNITIEPADWTGIGYDFIIQNEDHTLGDPLQTWMDSHIIVDEYGKNGTISFAGKKIPHPLRDEMVFRIGFPPNTDKEKVNELAVRTIFADAARACASMFTEWLTMWTDTVAGKKGVAPLLTAKAKRAYKVATGLENGTAAWGDTMMEENKKEAPAVPPAEVITGVPKGISADQPGPKQDKRRGTFWKKDPL